MSNAKSDSPYTARDSLRAIVAQHRSLTQTAHRPWPAPSGRWLVGQSWLDLLFIHWPIAYDDLRRLVPVELEPDIFEGRCWLGVVPFRMRTVRFAGCPAVAGTSSFPEVNVRTYVTHGGRPGVFFLSLDAADWIAVTLGRRMYGLPYLWAHMTMRTGAAEVVVRSTRVQHGWPAAAFAATYGPSGPRMMAAPGTLEHWLTERYCFYTATRDRGIRRTEVHHAPWELHPGTLELELNTLLEPFAITPLTSDPLVHYSAAQHVVAWAAVPAER